MARTVNITKPKAMKWTDTVANKCRYGDIAEKIWGDWNILWEDSEADYQGHASFLAEKDGKYCFYEWWYGSCSGCDTWEAKWGYTCKDADVLVEKEMRDTALWLDDEQMLMNWLNMLQGKAPVSNPTDGGIVGTLDLLTGGLLGRINAIRAVFGMPPYTPPEK